MDGRAAKNINRLGPVPDGQDTKFVYSTQLEKDKFKKMSQDRIQGSSLLKPFSRLPYTYGEFGNMEIWKYFFWKKLEILM